MSEDFDPASYYDDYGEPEWDRLERDFYHRLEWEETLHFLKRHLPTTGHVLDVGGALVATAFGSLSKDIQLLLLTQADGRSNSPRQKRPNTG